MSFHDSSRAESPGMCGGGQGIMGEGQAATDYGGPVFNAGKFRFDSVRDEKFSVMERHGHICAVEKSLIHICSIVSDSFVTPWTVACQVPMSTEFSRQEYAR